MKYGSLKVFKPVNKLNIDALRTTCYFVVYLPPVLCQLVSTHLSFHSFPHRNTLWTARRKCLHPCSTHTPPSLGQMTRDQWLPNWSKVVMSLLGVESQVEQHPHREIITTGITSLPLPLSYLHSMMMMTRVGTHDTDLI